MQLLLDRVGWRPALMLMSVLSVCGVLAALPLGKPATSGGAKPRRRDAGPTSEPRPSAANRDFLLLYVAQLLISLVAFVPFAHLALFAKAKGWPAETGGYLIGVIGIGSLCGRLLLGIVAQSLGLCRAASLCAVLMATALALFLPTTDRWELGGAAALYGLGYGGAIGLTGPIVAEILGLRGICASVGFVMTSRALGILIGPWAVGLIAHRLGGYDLPFLACVALAAAAALLLGVLHRSTASRPLAESATA